MFYSHTFSLFDHIFSGSSWLDKWAALQLQFVDARLQTLLMSDQNIWFHGGGGGWKKGRMRTKSNELVPRKSWRVSWSDVFRFWTTHCFTKRVWKVYIYRLTINNFLGFLWARWGENDFIRLPLISWKSVVIHSGEYICVNLWVCHWQQGSPEPLLWIIKIG